MPGKGHCYPIMPGEGRCHPIMPRGALPSHNATGGHCHPMMPRGGTLPSQNAAQWDTCWTDTWRTAPGAELRDGLECKRVGVAYALWAWLLCRVGGARAALPPHATCGRGGKRGGGRQQVGGGAVGGLRGAGGARAVGTEECWVQWGGGGGPRGGEWDHDPPPKNPHSLLTPNSGLGGGAAGDPNPHPKGTTVMGGERDGQTDR